MENWLIIAGKGLKKSMTTLNNSSMKNKQIWCYNWRIKIEKKNRISQNRWFWTNETWYNKKKIWKILGWWNLSSEIDRIMEEMKNVAETYKICESSETHTSQNISSSSVYRVYSSLSVILQRDSQDKSPARQYLQLKTGWN